MDFMRSLAAVSLLLGLAWNGASQAASHPARYINAKYGFSVELPKDADVCGPTAPQPNHGVLLRPKGVTSPPCDDDIESGDRYTAIDAHYATESISGHEQVRKECEEMAFDSRGRVSIIPPPAEPGELNWVACRIDGADGSISEQMFARRAGNPSKPAIDYTVSLKTTARYFATDHAAFARWLGTIRFTPTQYASRAIGSAR